MQALLRSGLRLHYSELGSGPVILFVHGVVESAAIWLRAAEQLQQNFRCIMVDLPGHGASADQRGSFSMSFYSETLLEFMDALQLNDVVLCGHSMGGQISIVTALRAPSKIRSLALVNAAGLETFTPVEKEQLIAWTEKAYSAPRDRAQSLQNLAQHFGMNAVPLAEELLNHQDENTARFYETISASIKGMLNEPVFHFLPALQTSALLLYGTRDLLIPNRWLHPQLTPVFVNEAAAARIKNSKVIALPDCGHYAPLEKPAMLAEALLRELPRR